MPGKTATGSAWAFAAGRPGVNARTANPAANTRRAMRYTTDELRSLEVGACTDHKLRLRRYCFDIDLFAPAGPSVTSTSPAERSRRAGRPGAESTPAARKRS